MPKSRPHPLSSAERAERNRGIAAARAAGQTWARIAAQFDLSERQARRAAAEHARFGVQRLGNEEPERLLEETLQVYLWAAEKLVALAEHPDNTSAAVAAIRSRVDVAERRIALLSQVGHLPRSTSEWRVFTQVRELSARFIEVAERRGVPIEELVADLDEVMGPVTAGSLNGAGE